MPKANPKHNKKLDQSTEMGMGKKAGKCSIVNCSQEAGHHFSLMNVESYLGTLNLTVNEEATKTKRVGLCKEHYKGVKKLKDKDEKSSYSKMKDLSKTKAPKKDKQHYFLE